MIRNGTFSTYPFEYFPKYFDTKGIKEKIIKQLPLNTDKILIGRGAELVEVEERRKTLWLSNNSNLTFEYSGKVMSPRKIPSFLEVICLKLKEDFGIEFDGILINYYEKGDCSMGYHSDPVGNKWSNDFIVLSIGQSRYFIFRHKDRRDMKV